jgi:hypothetical protein
MAIKASVVLTTFWITAPYRVISFFRRFGEICCLHLQDDRIFQANFKGVRLERRQHVLPKLWKKQILQVVITQKVISTAIIFIRKCLFLGLAWKPEMFLDFLLYIQMISSMEQCLPGKCNGCLAKQAIFHAIWKQKLYSRVYGNSPLASILNRINAVRLILFLRFILILSSNRRYVCQPVSSRFPTKVFQHLPITISDLTSLFTGV